MALHSLRQQRETGCIDYEILAFDEAQPPQFIEQREKMRCIARARRQPAEAINASGLLSACRQRPHRRAAEQRDELTPFQWECLPCFQPEDTTAGGLLHCGISAPSMSALGHKRTNITAEAMSALPPKADKQEKARPVCFVP